MERFFRGPIRPMEKYATTKVWGYNKFTTELQATLRDNGVFKIGLVLDGALIAIPILTWKPT
jgi:hypothetical protein